MSKQSLEYRMPGATAIALLVLMTAACSEKESSAPTPAQTGEAPVAQIAEQPVAKIAPTPEPASEPVASEPAAAAAAPDSSAVGEGVYQKACKSCHDLGVANAPKLGDAAAWAPRIAKGHDTLFKSVMNGLNAMPPKGACMSCSDAELRSAMEYMIVKGS